MSGVVINMKVVRGGVGVCWGVKGGRGDVEREKVKRA